MAIECKSTRNESVNDQLEQIDKELQELNDECNRNVRGGGLILNFKDAMERNKKLKDDFDIEKAKLRTRALFNPIELCWDDIVQRYVNNVSLPPTSWRDF